VVTCAFRARRNMRPSLGRGRGIAVWFLSGLSACSPHSMPGPVPRLCSAGAALVAAWLCTGHVTGAPQAVRPQRHWRLTTERILVWLRLAEPSARAAGDVDAHRRSPGSQGGEAAAELRAAGPPACGSGRPCGG